VLFCRKQILVHQYFGSLKISVSFQSESISVPLRSIPYGTLVTDAMAHLETRFHILRNTLEKSQLIYSERAEIQAVDKEN